MTEQDSGPTIFRKYVANKVLEEYPVVDPDSALDIGLFLTKGGGYLPLEVTLYQGYKYPLDEFKNYGNGVFKFDWSAGPVIKIAVTDAEKLHELLRRSEVVRVRTAKVEELY